jgi:RNA polymerase sigma-70 factor (ECF subfamily)
MGPDAFLAVLTPRAGEMVIRKPLAIEPAVEPNGARDGLTRNDTSASLISTHVYRREQERTAGAGPATGSDHEHDLLKRVATRDNAAFQELYFLYHRRLARFLTRLVRRYDIAEEVINDTMWVVWRKAADFRGASKVSTWIMGIAYRRALKTLQRVSAITSHENPTDHMPELTTEEPQRTEELREWLGLALERLPLEQRLVLELTYFLGHSCEEVATIMECPVNTVKTRMFHARQKMKVMLPQLAGPQVRSDL